MASSAFPSSQNGAFDDQVPIDADDLFDDSDSALGDSTLSYTTSLTSSIENYPVEYGRRYHAYQAGKYLRPNDEQEMDRLLIMHTVVTKAIDGLYRAPIDREKAQRILDIGTGNGVWAIEMADLLPNATILGNDLSANMPNFIPPNVKFEVDDVENDWIYDTPFTYIFSRYMVASISNWPRLVDQAYDHLAPGGWAEFQDFDLTYYSDDGSLKDDDPLLLWISLITQASEKVGRDTRPGHQLKGWLTDAGFTNIVHERYKLPIGPWAKDARLKQIGIHNYMQLIQGLEGFTLRLSTQVLGMPIDEVKTMLSNVRKTLHNPHIHPILVFHVCYGQKPAETK